MTLSYYHICSDGNFSSVLFRNATDFKAAMNRIAVCAYKTPGIKILALLISNAVNIRDRESFSELAEAIVEIAEAFPLTK